MGRRRPACAKFLAGLKMACASQQSANKRARPRKCLQVPIRITPSARFSLTSGQTEDISPLGLKVRIQPVASPLNKGDDIDFIINEDFFDLHGQGRIIWTSANGDILGVQFTQPLDKKVEKSLDDFLRFLLSLLAVIIYDPSLSLLIKVPV